MTLEHPSAPKRKVGILLGIGIFLLPIVFAWFTLRRGHSTLSRVVSFVWLALISMVWIGNMASAPAPPVKADSERVAAEGSPGADVDVVRPETPPAPRSKWTYTEDHDAMRGSTAKFAMLNSENEVRFDFPYNGGSTGSITVRRRTQDGLQVMIGVDKGQFMCNSFSGTSINVKFDDGPIQRFNCTDTSSGEANTIFLTNPRRFLTALKASEKVIVEAEFYQHGPAQFTFDTTGLEFE